MPMLAYDTVAGTWHQFPTIPTFVAAGATASGTGNTTPALPTGHTTNDILILVVQSSNEVVTAPAGYTQLGPANGIGGSASVGTTRLTIFWKRDGGSESDPTVTDPGDHNMSVVFAIRGCPTTGDPFLFGGNSQKSTASTTGTGPTSVTNIDNIFVCDIFAGGNDGAAAQASAEANSDLGSVTEAYDDGVAAGNGGSITVVTGTKIAAGPIGSTTLTWANSTNDVCTRIHFLPSDLAYSGNQGKPAETQMFIGSAMDFDDTWVKPTGARRVHVQLMGGGGSGSSGHTVTTPSGGGGGGGGMYAERWFNASDLGATVTLHAGKGGAATTAAVDQAGNNGVDSTFGTLVRAVAGTGASVAASADGGNGGSGGGTTVPAANTLQTIASGELGTAGGNGSTTGVAGSPGERGGGGGASGTTAANTTVVAGLSKYGGGGGGGGANTGTITAGGAGGGAAAPAAAAGTNGTASTDMPYGGSGADGGNATTAPGGTGGFPGGGGGGGGGNNAATQGGRGGHGCVLVTTYF